jgi:hypothetical protein
MFREKQLEFGPFNKNSTKVCFYKPTIIKNKYFFDILKCLKKLKKEY